MMLLQAVISGTIRDQQRESAKILCVVPIRMDSGHYQAAARMSFEGTNSFTSPRSAYNFVYQEMQGYAPLSYRKQENTQVFT